MGLSFESSLPDPPRSPGNPAGAHRRRRPGCDAADRLTGSLGAYGSLGFEYDANSNRITYGEAAEHIADAQKAGYPEVLTIARDGAPENRKGSIGGLPKVLGKQLDEYPPAMFKEGGRGASVRPISPRDNMAAGACIGNGCRGLRNGEKVRIKVVD